MAKRGDFLAAGLAVALAACGGGEKADDGPSTTPPAQQQPAPAPPQPGGDQGGGGDTGGSGASHDVNMIFDGSAYKFDPAQLTVKAGDVVRFHNKSGGPHNVQFYPDSIPQGAAAILDAGMSDRIGPLAGPLIAEPNAVYQVSFAKAPGGLYKYFCLPHQALGMVAEITVQ